MADWLQDLISHILKSLPILPDREIRILVDGYGLSLKDSKTLVGLDSGDRLDYFHEVMACLRSKGDGHTEDFEERGRATANW